MSLNETPSGERVHIGFFGRRNAGKSSLVNAITGQELAVVSETRGTTTDPVRKAMELLPIGPVLIVDTPGFDDEGTLGEKRVRKTKQELNRTDVAVLVVDACEGMQPADQQLLALFQEKQLPYLIVWNKSDLLNEVPDAKEHEIWVSATEGTNIWECKEQLARLGSASVTERALVSDLLDPLDVVVLVIPIDKAAPKGRLILPQQQVLRDVLDSGAIPICTRETELSDTLLKLKAPPKLVITDSQVFDKVNAILPADIPLTSFSILMARYKGLLDAAVRGVRAVDQLQDGDIVLIAEGCTHHRQCDDIGTVKLPRWLKQCTGKDFVIETSSGRDFPEDLSKYALIIHCGGCMLNEREIRYRMQCAQDQNIPITNYGIFIAHFRGILERSIAMLPGYEE
jgi:[FeFe] hydrogenase H-cluster maturation GTPase HydF